MKPGGIYPLLLLALLSAVRAEPADNAKIRPVNIQAMAEAITRPKAIYAETPLFREGKPTSLLVAPATGLYGSHVQAIQTYLKGAAGAELPLKKDTKVTDEDYREHHLLALGNLSTNRVARRMYTKQFTYCDRVFPGKGQFVIRTIHDPLGYGRNVVLLGGSDAEGIRAAALEFIEVLKALKTATLPHLIIRKPGQFDIDALPEKKTEEEELFDEPTKLDGAKEGKSTKPTHPIVRLLVSGEPETVWSRLEQWALRYILDGDLAAAKEYKEAIVALADYDRGCKSRTAKWFQKQHMIWQYWNQLEECGLFTDSERLIVDRFTARLAFAGFNELVNVEGLGAPLTDPGRTENNHWSGLWQAQVYYGIDYLHTYYRSAAVEQAMRAIHRFVDGLPLSFKPDEDATGYQEGFQEVKAKLLLHAGKHEFFTNGNARRTADILLMPLTNLGTLAAYGDASGPRGGFRQANTYLNVATLLLGDGQYAWAAHHHRAAKGFYRSQAARHAYPNDLPMTEPTEHVGLKIQPLDPAFCRRWKKDPPAEGGFDKITLRAGWAPTDDYLMLQGIGYVGIHPHYDTNTVVRYQAKGQDWLVDDSYTHTAIRSHSLVTIARGGHSTPLPPFARLDAAFAFEEGALVRTTVPGWSDADWTRNVFWSKNAFVAIIDEVKAREPGTFMLRNLWRHTGRSRIDGDTLVSDQKDTRFYLASADLSTPSIHPAGESLRDKRPVREFWRLAGPALEREQSYAFLSLLWAQPGDEPPQYTWTPVSEHAALLDDGKSPAIVGVGNTETAVSLGQFRIGARAFWVSSERIVLAQASQFAVGLSSVLDAERPVTVELDLVKGQTRFADASAEIQVPLERLATVTKASLPPLRRAARSFATKRQAAQSTSPAEFVWSVECAHVPSLLMPANLDDHVADELLASSGKEVFALDLSGQELWRLQAPSRLLPLPPVITDVDGDGKREILVAADKCSFLLVSLEGELKRRINLPLPSPNAFAALNLGVFGGAPKVDDMPALEEEPADEDGFEGTLQAEQKKKDMIKEIVLGYRTDRFNGKIDAFNLEGTRGWSVSTKGYAVTLWAGDLNGDGKDEILNAASRTDWDVRNLLGKVVSANSGLGGAKAACLVDLDGDGRVEIVATESWYDNVFVLAPNLRCRWKHSTGEDPVGPAIADLDGDGKKEILVGSMLGNVNCYSHEGKSRWVAGTQLPLSQLVVIRAADGNSWVLAAGARALAVLDADGSIIRRLTLPAEVRHMLVANASDGREVVVLALSDGRVCRARGL